MIDRDWIEEEKHELLNKLVELQMLCEQKDNAAGKEARQIIELTDKLIDADKRIAELEQENANLYASLRAVTTYGR